jgi:putative ABC transport system permease protein
MFKNNLKIIVRKLRKEKLYSFVNIAGLTVGLTAFLLIALYVRDELSFDEFHENKENIYRVISQNEERGGYSPQIVSDYVEYFKEDIPQIDAYSRITIQSLYSLVESDEATVNVEKVLYTDANFFDFFSFELEEGTAQGVFSQGGSAVISKALSEKLFGEVNPVGKSVKLDREKTVIISGVSKAVPKNSYIQFEMVVYENGLFKNEKEGIASAALTYISLTPGLSPEGIGVRIEAAKDKPMYRGFLKGNKYELLPLLDLRLNAPFEFDYFDKNDIRYVTLFSGIGLVVLLLALINYINLVTAQSTRRVKEIGLRKVIGANKAQLIFSQLSESVVLTFISFVFAFAIAERLLPYYNALLDKSITLQYASSEFFIWVFLAGIALGLIAGLYPAFYIARFKPLALLNKSTAAVGNKGYLRKFLVLFQFVSSGLLLVVLAIMFSQMNFLKTKDLGFNPDFVIQIPLYDDMRKDYQTLKNEIERVGGVESATATGWTVGRGTTTALFDAPNIEGEEPNNYMVNLVMADKDYAETIGLKFQQKADGFDISNLKKNQIIVNEAFIEKFGWEEEPIGKKAYGWGNEENEIVAVIADFHTYSLKQKVEPLYISSLAKQGGKIMLVKIDAKEATQVIENVGSVYASLAGRPFEFYYLDDKIKAFYKKEQGQFMLFQVFAGLAVFISLLGLIALTIYTVEQRRKEVSIRKVLGASIQNLLLLLNKEYTLLVFLAFLIASPIAYYAMQGWLAEFKYRIDISPFLFIGAFLSFLVLSWMVTGLQSIKVSKENPADVLREE